LLDIISYLKSRSVLNLRVQGYMMYSLQPIVSFTSLSIAYSSEPGVYFVMIAASI